MILREIVFENGGSLKVDNLSDDYFWVIIKNNYTEVELKLSEQDFKDLIKMFQETLTDKIL